ncbi:MAG: KilA-N domain-containing protein [Saprospiraceae bacterium]
MSKRQVTKVQGISTTYHTIDSEEYINLTDIARHKDDRRPELPLQTWMNNMKTIEFLLAWEEKNNPNFKHGETTVFSGYKNFAAEMVAGKKTSATKWIKYTNAKGIKVVRGKYGGTFAHRNIAFHFASWVNASFYLHIIEEFKKKKKEELLRLGDPFDSKRQLTAGNHTLLVASILSQMDERLLTHPQPYKSRLPFAAEVDMINKIVFGFTAQEWRENNMDKPVNRNMRDYASILDLVTYQNLEVVDAMLLQWDCSKKERKELLQETYNFIYPILKRTKTVKRMQAIHDQKMNDLSA